MKSSITQIERRFDIPSSLIGVIDGSFEMGRCTVWSPQWCQCQETADFWFSSQHLISTANVRLAQKDTVMQVKAGKKETTKQNVDFYIQMHSENSVLLA